MRVDEDLIRTHVAVQLEKDIRHALEKYWQESKPLDHQEQLRTLFGVLQKFELKWDVNHKKQKRTWRQLLKKWFI